jgi:hypothetical protein
MGFPAKLRSQIPGHKAWISLNLNRIAKAKLGASLSQLSSSSQTPTQTFSYLESVSNHVRQVGRTTVGGVTTTKYDATISLTKTAGTKTPQVKAAIAKLESELHRSSLPVQVWIDNQHRVRQISYQLSVPVAGGKTSHIDLTLGVSSYGVPVTVKAPPASQTYYATGAALHKGS